MSLKIPLRNVIAQRAFDLVRPDGARRLILVRLARPIRRAADEYCCRYLISGLGRPRSRSVSGFDSLQALMSALHMVSGELEKAYRDGKGRLYWIGQRNLGLPNWKHIAHRRYHPHIRMKGVTQKTMPFGK